MAVGALANIEVLQEASTDTILYIGFVMFGTVILHFILGALFKMERGLLLMASIAGIFGPPFVFPMAKVLKRDDLMIIGVGQALLGLVIGNYLGLSFYYFLSSM